ncbi:hypothetical protein F5Y04DRAFT_162850 [Hypomontagnella monticulosa]|nr:hypothetical protein F5Y04DRAFT_162850 [Hypomontagnella monticulosa]
MAQSQHVAAKHRSRRRHQTRSPSPSRHHDWDSRHDPTPHSLPYRSREPEIQRSAGRFRSKHYSQRSASPSDESVDIPDPMPHPQHQLARSATVGARNGKGRAVYLEVEEDDDEGEQMISRLRSRSRPRTQSKTRSLSSSGDDETYELSTPPRSTPLYRSRPTSRLPSASTSRSSSVDTDSTVSTQDERTKRPVRRGRVEVPVTPPPPAPPVVDRAERRRHRRRHRDRSAYQEESDDEPEIERTLQRLRERSKSVPRERRPMNSRSTSRRRHHHRDVYDDAEPSSSKRQVDATAGIRIPGTNVTVRPHRRRYYESDAVIVEKPALQRARTAPSSHVTSHSMSSSSRRSSAFLNRFMGPGLQTPPERHEKMVECVVCLDDLKASKTAKLKCGHRMCKSCLKRSFKLSVKDPAQMPPRCCTSDCIPLKHVDHLFDVDFKRTWNHKYHEFSTRNRVYCPGRKCGRWIRPDQIQRHRNGRKVGRCGSCQTRVCCECNNKWHGSSPCPADEETNQILQQAKEEGWQRCYNCRNMVELKEGCNHMTWYVINIYLGADMTWWASNRISSRCGAEFCMICGLRWKICECPWFTYDGADADPLDHMQIPEPVISRERLGLRSAPPTQGLDPRLATGSGPRPRPSNYDEEVLLRRLQEQRDADLAQRLQQAEMMDDTEDDYMEPDDIMGNAGHFMHDPHRRRAQTVVAPPAPAPPPVAPFGGRAGSVADYVTGVSKARGVRANSMERRLADRFEQRQGGSPTHHSFGHPIPPPPAPPRAMGPSQPPMMPTPHITRRHTIDDDLYDAPRGSRVPERMIPRRAATRGYADDPAFYEPGPRIRRRERTASTSPKDSVLAGLTGPGRGMHRVYEWVNHVEADPNGIAT